METSFKSITVSLHFEERIRSKNGLPDTEETVQAGL